MTGGYTVQFQSRWPKVGPWLVVGPRGICSHHAEQWEALKEARRMSGCAICGQRNPHREDCPKFGATRYRNMTGGRMSDAVRSEIAAFRRLGRVAYVAAADAERKANR